MKKFAVIGKDVSKSLSPEIHSYIARATGRHLSYERLSIAQEDFQKNVKSLFEKYDGFNVTIPYKLSIIPYLDRLVGDAKVFGAVNCVRVSDMTGHNTDGSGFALMLKNNGIGVNGKDVLLLGAGGAGRSVAKKLSDAGAKVYVYDVKARNAINLSREFTSVYALDKIDIKKYFAIVNASGVGMHATEGISPVGEELIKNTCVAVDLIYEPSVSEFLRIAQNLGKIAINGRAMLFYQAYYAQSIFFGEEADEARAKELFDKFKEEVL